MKKCPVCKEKDLITHKISQNVEVDVCPQCAGIWFEKGEIGEFSKFSEDIPGFRQLVKDARASAKLCPQCSLQMKEMKYAASAGLMIDYCESCSGVWLDGGEIRELNGITGDPNDIKLRISREVWNVRFKLHKTSSLTCPKCNASSLHNFKTSEGVTLDLCDKCKGVWLDKGETAKSAEMESDFPDYEYALSTAKETALKCPSCKRNLFTMKYAKNSDLMVEHCKGCGGLFLDAGEMPKVETIGAATEGAGRKLARCLKEMYDEGYVKLM